MIQTSALSPYLGVEVTGVEDLLDDTVVARLTEALKWRGVLLVRGLHLDDEAQIAFSRKLGEVVRPAGDEIFKVSLNPSVNPAAEYLKGTFNWHIDGTTVAVPIKSTLLTARHVAMVGGGTEFANTQAAYENLPAQDRKRYEDLRVVHSFAAAQLLVKPDPSDEELAAWRAQTPQEVSLVQHRRDGRTSLAIGATADHVVGVSPDESRSILDELLAWATQERFCYAHQWQVGDFVMWDNMGMLHRALPYDPTSERTLHRTTITGDEAWT